MSSRQKQREPQMVLTEEDKRAIAEIVSTAQVPLQNQLNTLEHHINASFTTLNNNVQEINTSVQTLEYTAKVLYVATFTQCALTKAPQDGTPKQLYQRESRAS